MKKGSIKTIVLISLLILISIFLFSCQAEEKIPKKEVKTEQEIDKTIVVKASDKGEIKNKTEPDKEDSDKVEKNTKKNSNINKDSEKKSSTSKSSKNGKKVISSKNLSKKNIEGKNNDVSRPIEHMPVDRPIIANNDESNQLAYVGDETLANDNEIIDNRDLVEDESGLVIDEEDTEESEDQIEPLPEKKDEITKKQIILTSAIPFEVIDNYKDSGSESKIIQEGENGLQTIVEEITYKNGIQISKEEISREIIKEPISKIIARKVLVKEALVEKIEVEDKTKPIYESVIEERWAVITIESSEEKTFSSENEAIDYQNSLADQGIESILERKEDLVTEKLIAYEMKMEEVIIEEAVYEWKQ